MFTQTDLDRLMTRKPATAISLFMPTHATGKEVRQDPIRLKNLVSDAQVKLIAAGISEADADVILAPATAFLRDNDFWQHQSEGLALFIDHEETTHYRVPLDLDEAVVVGTQFHIRPLLPLLAADDQFSVLTLTADAATLFRASRFDLTEDSTVDFPENAQFENDYENPVQASPPARPNVGTANISNAQVYGDSPPEFRKARLLDFVAGVAKATEQHLAASHQPVVLVADAETSGHFQQASGLGARLAGVVQTNPNALDASELHSVSYSKVKDRLDSERRRALSKAAELLGRGDETATSSVADIVRAAHQGRVGALLLNDDGAPVWGRYDSETDALETGVDSELPGDDLLDIAALATFQNGGTVHVASAAELPDQTQAVALLRY